MHLWLDINKVEHISFFSVLIKELKERGHRITITSCGSRELKAAFLAFKLDAKTIRSIPSFFGLFKEQSNMFRAVNLLSYIKNRNIDAAFSLGSEAMFYSCLDNNLPIILFVDDYEKLPHKLYLVVEKCFFIVSNDISDQKLIEKGFDIKKTAKYKGLVKKEDLNPDLKSTKEITDKIEFLSKYMPDGLSA